MIRRIIQDYEESLNSEKVKNEKRLKNAPEGKLIHFRDKHGVRFYHLITVRGKVQRRYLGRDQRELARKLALKEYLEKRNLDIEENLEAIAAFKRIFWRGHKDGRYFTKSRVDRLLEEKTGIRELLGREDLMEWAKAPYEKLGDYEEHLIHFARKDQAVRSKSEEIIMNVLDRYGIPYRYDCAMDINGSKLHPDFVIRHPKTGKLIIWEHFGLMDKEDYRMNARSKISQYIMAGFTPMIDLIITSEKADRPMDTFTAESIVKMLLQ